MHMTQTKLFYPEIYIQHNQIRNGAKIRNRYNQISHLTQDINGKVTNSKLDIPKDSHDVSPFPADDHKVTIIRHARKYNKHKLK